MLSIGACVASRPPLASGPERVTVQRPPFCRGVPIPPLGDDIRRSWAERTAVAKAANERADACGAWIDKHYGGKR